MRKYVIACGLLVGVAGIAAAQSDAQKAPAQGGSMNQQMSACVQSQQTALGLTDVASQRIELARQTNQAAALRAAIDDLQSVLSTIRTQLAACAELQASAASVDPHAGHSMNMNVSGATGKSPAPAPGTMPSADPHAGHVMPANAAPARPTPQNPTTASQAGRGGTAATADAHAGHTIPSASPAAKGATAAKPMASPPAKAAASDPHAGHAMPSAGPESKGATPSKPAPATAGGSTAADAHAGHSGAQASDKAMDPVNGLMVDPATAPSTSYQGQTYHFSSEESRKEFLESPTKFAKKPAR